MAKILQLENEAIRIGIDESTGALVELLHKESGWAVQNRAELAQAFSLVAPLPERLLNQIDGTAETISVERSDSAKSGDHSLTITWDRDGKKYGKGKGLQVYADGKLIGSRETLGRLTAQLPKKQ